MRKQSYRQYPLLPIFIFLVLIAGFILIPSATTVSQQTTNATTTFPVGAGFSDVVPRQLIRASNDRVYVFAAKASGSTTINAFWTTAGGLPNSAADFNGSTSVNGTGILISVDAVYDGGSIVHVLANDNSGVLKDYPFDTTTGTFKAPTTLSTGNPTVAGDYIGTSGVSGMVDKSNNLHVAYWASGNHIVHRAYNYNSGNNTLTPVTNATQVDTNGASNHPALVVSPADNSVTVAWVSEATNPARILARTRTSAGAWGAVENVSTAAVWTSTSFGINIDQGPSVVIDSAGTKHLAYIENWDSTGHYGHVHYVTNSGAGWVDTTVPTYSHDPALAINSAGEIYLIGHGPESTNQNKTMYLMRKTGPSSWGPLEQVIAPPAGSSFDASVSVRWSVVGFNRPDTIEFIFFLANAGSYYNTTLYYGRIASSGTPPSTGTPPPPPSATPIPPTGVPPTATSQPANDVIFSDGFESGNLNAWPGSFVDNNSVTVNTSAALIGSYGAAIVINDNNTVYALNDTPNNESRYRARFYFDPNSISMSNNTGHYLFYATNPSTGVARVEFGRVNNSYALRIGIINDGNTWVDSAWVNISDAPHSVEIDWSAAANAGANNGYIMLWIDGAQSGNITGIDNDSRRVENGVLGAITGVDTSTRGTYYVDAFESRRQTYIGPAAGAPPTPIPTNTSVAPTQPPPPSNTPISPTNPPPPTLPPPPTSTQAPSNRPPVAVNDSLSTAKNTALTITLQSLLANDSDPDGNPLTITGYTLPSKGTVAANANGTATYTPNANFTGTDSFTYTISDGKGGTATATVSITVGP